MLHTYIVLSDFFEASRKKYLSRVIVDFIILSALHSQLSSNIIVSILMASYNFRYWLWKSWLFLYEKFVGK